MNPMPPLRGPRWHFAIFRTENWNDGATRGCLRISLAFFCKTDERDRQTDGQPATARWHRQRLCIASRGNIEAMMII